MYSIDGTRWGGLTVRVQPRAYPISHTLPTPTPAFPCCHRAPLLPLAVATAEHRCLPLPSPTPREPHYLPLPSTRRASTAASTCVDTAEHRSFPTETRLCPTLPVPTWPPNLPPIAVPSSDLGESKWETWGKEERRVWWLVGGDKVIFRGFFFSYLQRGIFHGGYLRGLFVRIYFHKRPS